MRECPARVAGSRGTVSWRRSAHASVAAAACQGDRTGEFPKASREDFRTPFENTFSKITIICAMPEDCFSNFVTVGNVQTIEMTPARMPRSSRLSEAPGGLCRRGGSELRYGRSLQGYAIGNAQRVPREFEELLKGSYQR